MSKIGGDAWFRGLRFNEAHHLGLGDIRLSIGQQDEIAAEFALLRKAVLQLARYVTGMSALSAIAYLDEDVLQLILDVDQEV
jgi:hypothetical protein